MSERLITLDDIVRQAESLSAQDRLPYLKHACAQDHQLLSQAVERLRHSSPQWWEHSIESRAFDPELASLERTGESIGPYRVLRALGEGGMGEVLLAERNDQQFRQQVAIKLVKRGALSRNVQSRLKAERQILASLDHPNIARLLDGGAIADGTPYIVMEYIEGEPIDVYCDKHQLTIEARLALFRTVCAAVHCAHQNLIVHRDLKQSNILVTREGAPKLLDFGIAKILDERQLIHTMAVTQLNMRVMTPEHASPEQIRGDAITTASDTYALGVLLYELLSGRKPYELKSSRLGEIEAAICEKEPLALDSMLPFRGKSNAQVSELCAVRSTNLTRFRRQLRGDLANIVMTALRKEPERRYASAEQFSADIERYLTGMPVAASKDSWQYRAHKFVSRHRLAVAATGLAVAGLAAFAVTTTLQARRIAQERARAAQVSTFLIDMFEQADPTHSRGREVSVREMLDIGSRRIATQLADQPDTRAHLQETVGKVYGGLGLYDDAERLLNDAITARTTLYGPLDPSTAAAKQNLGNVLVLKKDTQRAEPLLEAALTANRAAFGQRSLEVAITLRSIGELRQEQQQATLAEESLRESLQILEALSPDDSTKKAAVETEMAYTLNQVAIILRRKGDNVAAEQMYRRAIKVSEKQLGRDHPTNIEMLHNLALAVEAQGRLSEAKPLYNDSLDLCRQVFGAEHPETLAALANYGLFLQRLGDLDAAELMFREVLALRSKVLGEGHSRVGYDRVNLGNLLQDRGAYRDAEAQFRLALDIYAATLPRDHIFKGAAHRNLGVTLMTLGRNREAENELNRSVQIYTALLAPDNPQIAMSKAALGAAIVGQKRFAEAEPLLLDSYRTLLIARGADSPHVIRAHRWIEDLYRDWKKPEEAQRFFASAAIASAQK